MKQLADGFWNCRGSFKLAGVLDVGTQMSLVRRDTGRFLLLDSYAVGEEIAEKLREMTEYGLLLDAIINVHPFHTLHCDAMQSLFPGARLIGTQRHRDHLPDLPWEDGVIEMPSTQDEFAADLDFSVPDGLDLVTADDKVHAASVLVRHRASGIVHVDDTLNVFAAQGWLGKLLPQSRLRFHPTLSKALQPRSQAADDFTAWARNLAKSWSGSRIVCAAHSAVRSLSPDGWRTEVLDALASIDTTLSEHRARFG